jgi:putative metallohydrolase (TIGR04338 family)
MSKANPDWYELPKEQWQEKNEDGRRIWRDSFQSKLYDAERGFRNRFWNHKGGCPRFESIAEIQKYVDKIMSSAWITRRFGSQKPVTVFERIGGDQSCDANKGMRRIRMAKWGWNPVVVLHELAHILNPTGYGTPHGRFFSRILLELITWKFGDEARKCLKARYQYQGIKCNPHPAYSEETRKKMRERGRKLARKYLKPKRELVSVANWGWK